MPGPTYTGQSWLVLRTSALELEQLVRVTKSLRPNTLHREGMALTSGQGWGAVGQVQDEGTEWDLCGGEPSPGPDAGRWEHVLGEGHLIAVETDEMASAKASHHDTQCAEAHGADGKVAGPPGTDGQEDQEVDAGEG